MTLDYLHSETTVAVDGRMILTCRGRMIGFDVRDPKLVQLAVNKCPRTPPGCVRTENVYSLGSDGKSVTFRLVDEQLEVNQSGH